MGHLSRCIELAKCLKKHNTTSYFLIKNNHIATELIKKTGFQFFTLSRSDNEKKELTTLLELYKKIKFNCVFIDSKKPKKEIFFKKLNALCKTIVIDNTDKNSLNANLLIWPWGKEQYPKNILLQNSHKILVGPKYMLLGKITKNKIAKIPNSILISMGGADKRHLTEKIISAFKKTKLKFRATIIIGKFFSNKKTITDSIKRDNRFFIVNDNNIIALMGSYKIGILTYGITTFEAFFSGLPSVVISHSIENDRYAKKTAAYNCMFYLGNYRSINFYKLPYITFKLMRNHKLYKKYSANGKKLVDGKGTERVSKKIISLIRC